MSFFFKLTLLKKLAYNNKICQQKIEMEMIRQQP